MFKKKKPEKEYISFEKGKVTKSTDENFKSKYTDTKINEEITEKTKKEWLKFKELDNLSKFKKIGIIVFIVLFIYVAILFVKAFTTTATPIEEASNTSNDSNIQSSSMQKKESAIEFIKIIENENNRILGNIFKDIALYEDKLLMRKVLLSRLNKNLIEQENLKTILYLESSKVKGKDGEQLIKHYEERLENSITLTQKLLETLDMKNKKKDIDSPINTYNANEEYLKQRTNESLLNYLKNEKIPHHYNQELKTIDF